MRCGSTLLALCLLAPVSSFAESSEVIAPRGDVHADVVASERGAERPTLFSRRTARLIARPDVLWLVRGNLRRFELEFPALGSTAAEPDARSKDALNGLGIDLETAVPRLLHYETKDSQVSLLLAPGGGCTACLKLEGVF